MIVLLTLFTFSHLISAEGPDETESLQHLMEKMASTHIDPTQTRTELTELATNVLTSDDNQQPFHQQSFALANFYNLTFYKNPHTPQTLYFHVCSSLSWENTDPQLWGTLIYTHTQEDNPHTLHIFSKTTPTDANKALFNISVFLSDGSGTKVEEILKTSGPLPKTNLTKISESYCANYNGRTISIANTTTTSIPVTGKTSLYITIKPADLNTIIFESEHMQERRYTFHQTLQKSLPPQPQSAKNFSASFKLKGMHTEGASLDIIASNDALEYTQTGWKEHSQSHQMTKSITVSAPKTVDWSQGPRIILAMCQYWCQTSQTYTSGKILVFAEKTGSSTDLESYTIFAMSPQRLAQVACFETEKTTHLKSFSLAQANISFSNYIPPCFGSINCLIITERPYENAIHITTDKDGISFYQYNGCQPTASFPL